MNRNNCKRCNKELTGKQKSWCSAYCSKLGLKSIWRKKHLEQIKIYNNQWRKAKNGGTAPLKNAQKHRESECLNCHSSDDLQVAHIKPIGLGGTHTNIITLCRKCHYHFDERLRGFWVL